MKERRRRDRLKLRFPVQLCRKDSGAISALTDDLSVSGFYCTSDEPFSPGECLSCEISIPEAASVPKGGALALHCQVKVVRVEVRGLEPGFGIACQFEDREVASV